MEKVLASIDDDKRIEMAEILTEKIEKKLSSQPVYNLNMLNDN